MKVEAVIEHISKWLSDYCNGAGMNGFVIGISGGIDSAVTSVLAAKTGKNVICLNMPIHQSPNEISRAKKHIDWLKSHFTNVSDIDIDLTHAFEAFRMVLPEDVHDNHLALANTRSRLRMAALYAVGQENKLLVTGTGNKIEDFGIGFYTKYGDGGVDISPIADLLKSEVFKLGAQFGIIEEIQTAAPTDGLWFDNRTDEEAIGATYDELEWAMTFEGRPDDLSDRQQEILKIYKQFNTANRHKMEPIPVCKVPAHLK